MATISLHFQYLGGVRVGDMVAGARVRRRRRAPARPVAVAHVEVIHLAQA
ncbi:MAG: hypothetical protein ACRDV9_08750 [Acidimicrobiia bacterium]